MHLIPTSQKKQRSILCLFLFPFWNITGVQEQITGFRNIYSFSFYLLLFWRNVLWAADNNKRFCLYFLLWVLWVYSVFQIISCLIKHLQRLMLYFQPASLTPLEVLRLLSFICRVLTFFIAPHLIHTVFFQLLFSFFGSYQTNSIWIWAKQDELKTLK